MKRSVYYLISAKLVIIVIILLVSACREKNKEKDLFSIAFLTDIHLQPEQNAVKGFTQALDTINKLKPDFIITGGDLIMDALGQRYGLADSLYNLYSEVIKKSKSPVYNTMGNHEIYGIYKRSGADPANPEYGEKMFEKRLGQSYQSFDHKGWKFMIINSVEDTKKGKYVGKVDSAQIKWIKSELKKTEANTPIVLSTHIPFITANTQKYEGSTLPNDSSLVVFNSKEVIDLFNGYNLKLVLQGHLHTVEDIYIDGIHFITGGAISGGWWKGPNRGFEEGFMFLTFGADDFHWKYVDYGWKVEAQKSDSYSPDLTSPLKINGMDLVWNDEFNNTGKPDPAKWTYETGFVRNEELQWYQQENANCSNGILLIEGRREKLKNPEYIAGSKSWETNREFAAYTSSSINTKGIKEFLFGRFEIRARIDTALGSWPAIWTLGISKEWPSNGEIDVMEFYRWKGVPTILANFAWGTGQRYTAKWDDLKKPFSDFTAKDPDWVKKFHVWRMDWNKDSISLFLDDQLLNSVLISETVNPDGFNPMLQPHYLLLNLAIGGNGGDPSKTKFPVNYEVDYVRVYQEK